MKRKEQRWTATTARLRERVESLEKEKQDLNNKVEELEKINSAQQQRWKQVEVTTKQPTLSQVAKKVDEQWDKIMDTAENQPSSSSSSRQGRKTPLSSTTNSLNIKNQQQIDKPSTSSANSAASSKTSHDKRTRTTGDKKLPSDQSASSSDKVKPAARPVRKSNIHTAPIISNTANTDDTDNDITTDSDMAQLEDDKVVVSSSVLTGLLNQLANKQSESRNSRQQRVRPASARDRRQASLDRERDRTASKDRTSKERRRSRDRLSARETREYHIPALNIYEQDRQEPDGRSSRQGRHEDKQDVKAKQDAAADEGGRRSNNTGSSEPPTVIEVLHDGKRSRTNRPQTSPIKSRNSSSPVRRSQSSRERSMDRRSLRRGYSSEAIDKYSTRSSPVKGK